MTRNMGPGEHDHSSRGHGGATLSPDALNNVTWVKPGDDLQSRVDAAVVGGVLAFAAGSHDVATMGTATVNKPLNVFMPTGGEGNSQEGAVLLNDGGDAVAGPVLDFANTSPGTFSSRPRFAQHYLNIRHEGTGPAVRYNGYSETLCRPLIDCNGAGQDGVEIVGESFLFHLWNPTIRRHTRYGINEHANGGSYHLFGGNIVGTAGGSATAHIHAERPWTGYGGQLGGGASTGLEVLATGSRWNDTRIEGPDVGIQVGDTGTRADDNRFEGTYFVSIGDRCIDFVNSAANALVSPSRLMDGTNAGGVAARWTANSNKDKLAGSWNQLATKSWTIDASAVLPTVQFDPLPVLRDTERGSISQPVEGMRFYNQTDGNINIYDGAGWILPDGTVT